MKQSGVKPIAIFDEPGPREWKTREHLRRQATRSLHLARSLLEDARRERLGKVEGVLQETRRLLKEDQLPSGLEVDIENELLSLDELDLKTIPVPEDPGKKALQDVLLLLKDCRASSRPGEKHTARAVDQVLRERALKRGVDEGEVDTVKAEGEESTVTTATSDPTEGLAASLKDVEEKMAKLPLVDATDAVAAETAVADGRDTDDALLEKQLEEDDVEDIATVVVEPSPDFTESIRQTALTAHENYLVSDIIKTMTSASPSQTTLLEHQQELRNLLDRAKEVSKTYERSHAKPTAQDMEEARELLEVMGVPIIQAVSPYEAEGLCAAMVLGGMADYAGTEDSDVLVYGAMLLKNVGTSTLPLLSIDGQEFRTALEMTEEQYRDFLILNGTDACERIHGIGFKRALKLIKEHTTIETILDKAQSKKVSLRELTEEGYLDRVGAARRVFSDLPNLPDAVEVQQQDVDTHVIEGFLRERHGIATLSVTDTFSLGDEVILDDPLGTVILGAKGEDFLPTLPDDVPDWMLGADPPDVESRT